MKKILIIILIVLVPFITKAEVLSMGDVDGDNKIGSADYILVRKHILKTNSLTGNNLKRADMNGDDKISSIDYIAIRKVILGDKAKKRIRVGTMNIASYECGTGAGGAVCTTTNDTLAKLYKDNSVDVVGIQEGNSYRMSSFAEGIKELSEKLNYDLKYVAPFQINAIFSIVKTQTLQEEESNLVLDKCGEEPRALIKTIININNVNVSVYNVHNSWENDCPERHIQSAANYIKNDPNPVIIMGDFNSESIEPFNKYFKPIGFINAAHDTNYHSVGAISYMDSVWINPKGHINVVKEETVHTHNIISDHNLIVATLDIY